MKIIRDGIGAYLGHDELDVLALQASSINLLALILLLVLLTLNSVGSSLLVGSGSEISLEVRDTLTSLEVLSGGSLGLGVEVLNLGLSEDDPGVASRGLVDIRIVDNKQDLGIVNIR